MLILEFFKDIGAKITFPGFMGKPTLENQIVRDCYEWISELRG